MKRLTLPLLALLLAASPLSAAIYSVGLDKNNYTSDFMIGKVVVAICFLESNGGIDPKSENWSEARKAQVISKIMAGHTWWTKQNPRSPLSFTYVVKTLPTRYEPITRPYYHESYWVPDAMSSLGYNGTRFTATHNYINDLRTQYHADWGFVIFVVDSLNDSNGAFTDGYFAYSYLGGPFMVMTYDNAGYGIGNMDVVAAHEMGHIFYALDEYAGGPASPNDYSFGYFPTINGNHEWAATGNDATSIMRGGLRWGLDNWARLMIGWRDLNNNNVDDILDQTPTITISPQTLSNGSGDTVVQGQAKINVLPRQGNANGYGMTVDSISKVEYRYGNNSWQDAAAVDGTFDSPSESFQIDVPQSQALNIQSAPFNPASISLEVKAVTVYSQNAGNVPTGAHVASAGTLGSAHAYPNPFKPNSALNHTQVTFTGLTADAKVQIFSPAGEPVYDATSPTGADLPWTAVDKDGQKVSSGVYLYLITDPTGNKKQGKLAVIR